jgi:hypothetical protein
VRYPDGTLIKGTKMKPVFHNIFNGTFLLAVAFVCGFLLCYSTLDSPSGVGDGLPAPKGYKVVITTDVKCYKDGDEMTLKELQGKIGVEADGKLGYKTTQQVLLYNRTDKRNL